MLIKFSAYSVYTSEREAGKKKFSLYLGSAWQAVKAERVFKTLVTLFLRLKTLQSKRKKTSKVLSLCKKRALIQMAS